MHRYNKADELAEHILTREWAQSTLRELLLAALNAAYEAGRRSEAEFPQREDMGR